MTTSRRKSTLKPSWAAAYHEAAHVLVGLAVGRSVTGVFLRGRVGQVSYGERASRYHRGGCRELAARLHNCVAGYAAEAICEEQRLATGRWPLPARAGRGLA